MQFFVLVLVMEFVFVIVVCKILNLIFALI